MNRMRLFRMLLSALAAFMAAASLSAQSLEQAKRLFADGNYAGAKPAFARLYRQAPNNASYNYWYGVCCYRTGDLKAAETYLSVAVKRRVEKAYPYLADLYMKAYRFDEAARIYQSYIDLLTKKKEDTQAAQAGLALAEKAQRMVDTAENVQVIDSIVVGKKDFLSAYKLSGEGGTLESYRDYFHSREAVASTVYK
ncbi:MAG: tetratricopeptide repeat protein, partial [Tannerella sp.]|nr:tetratricopeptide repeat protein [Tannerella sp.]